MRRREASWMALAFAIMGGLTGCGGSGSSAVPMRDAVGRAVGAPAALTGFTVTVATDKATYRTGDTIHITVSATNNNPTARTLTYPTLSDVIKWGYILTTAADDKIVTYEFWTGHKLAFPAAVGSDTYAPGETKAFQYDFPFPIVAGDPDTIRSLAPGTYKVYAKMPALVTYLGTAAHYDTPTPASAPVTITITN